MAYDVSHTISPPAQESQLVLLVDDEAMITEGLAGSLPREGRTVVTCNDVESAELMVEHMRFSHILADIRRSGPFGFEALDFTQRQTPATAGRAS